MKAFEKIRLLTAAVLLAAVLCVQAVLAVTAEVEEKAEPTPALNIEEELAALSIQEEPSAPQEEEEAIPLTDDVWKVPQLVSSVGSQIRFAEDIMVPRGRTGGGRGRRGRGGTEETGKAKRAAARRQRGVPEQPAAKP